MCSIGEDDFGDEGGIHAMVPEPPAAVNTEPRGVCNKCGEECEVYKLNFREPECRACFLEYVRHKFRAVLGSSKILPRDASVLLVFDGSAEAMVLLDMLYHAQSQNTFKRLHCKEVVVLHIDDSALWVQTKVIGNHTQKERVTALQDFLAGYKNFKSYLLPIGCERAELPFPFQALDEYVIRNKDAEQAFVKRLNTIRSLTSRQDYLKHYRNRLIGAAAKSLQCGFAFLPDISTTLAADLLSAVALGRGGIAALDVALVDDRLGSDVQLVRPLKDLNMAEVELFMRARQLSPLQQQRYGANYGTSASLQNRTTAFMGNLQQNFASTVSTVFRIGDKIAPNRQLDKQMEGLALSESDTVQPSSCAFCNSPLDYADSATLLAFEFSRLVSEAGSKVDKNADVSTSALEQLQGEKNEQKRRLCHACRNIRADSDDSSIFSKDFM